MTSAQIYEDWIKNWRSQVFAIKQQATGFAAKTMAQELIEQMDRVLDANPGEEAKPEAVSALALDGEPSTEGAIGGSGIATPQRPNPSEEATCRHCKGDGGSFVCDDDENRSQSWEPCDACNPGEEAKPVAIESIAGIDPDFTGDETATEYVARLRGEEAKPELGSREAMAQAFADAFDEEGRPTPPGQRMEAMGLRHEEQGEAKPERIKLLDTPIEYADPDYVVEDEQYEAVEFVPYVEPVEEQGECPECGHTEKAHSDPKLSGQCGLRGCECEDVR